MKRGKVISILRFFSTIDKEIQMNNATIEDLNDRYYAALGAVNMDGLPHGKGGGMETSMSKRQREDDCVGS